MKSFSHYFCWEIDQYELLSRVAAIVNVKDHLTLYGFKGIIEIIYSYPNERKQKKDFWNQTIKSFFDNKAKSSISGENHIQFVSIPFKPNGKANA